MSEIYGPPAPERADRWSHGIPIAALVALTLGFYWRVTASLVTSQWSSDLEDGASFTWNLWYLPHALVNGENPFSTNDIFYPVGAELGFHTYVPFVSLVMWPVTKLFGLDVSWTVANLAGVALSGIGAYFLANHLLRSKWLAFFAGAAYSMLPARAMRMEGHLNLNHTEMLPFVLLAILKFYERPSKRNSYILGLLMGVSLLVEPVYMAFMLIAIAAIVTVRWRQTFTKPYLLAWLRAGIVGAVVASPALFAMTSELAGGRVDDIPGWGGAHDGSADLMSYLVPSVLHPIWGEQFEYLFSRVGGMERFTFPGWSLLVLAVVGVLTWRHRHKAVVLAVAATFFVLSLGPVLQVYGHQGDLFTWGDQTFSVPLPYVILHYIPVLNGLRVPARFGYLVALLLAILAAAGLQHLLRRLPSNKQRLLAPVLVVLATGVLALECLPGSAPEMTSSKIPKPYEVLAAQPGDDALLELPLQWRDGFGRTGDDVQGRDHTVFLYYATKHGKPISNGMSARYPDKREDRLESIPVYSQVLTLQGDQEGTYETPTFTATDLRSLGIGYVAAHRDRPIPDAFAYIERLNLPVLADDGNTIIWRVP